MSKIIFIAILGMFSAFERICQGPNGVLQCCADHVWNNETEQCIECSLGFYGENCQQYCHYPTFGRLCQSICQCDKALCDVRIGCTTSQCEAGYYGEMCQNLCPYPRFGRQCKKRCLSDNGTCNPINGCSASSKLDNQHDTHLQVMLAVIFVALVVLAALLGLYAWKRYKQDGSQSSEEVDVEEYLECGECGETLYEEVHNSSHNSNA